MRKSRKLLFAFLLLILISPLFFPVVTQTVAGADAGTSVKIPSRARKQADSRQGVRSLTVAARFFSHLQGNAAQASSASVGTVEFKSLDSKVLAQPVNFAVYLPASYAESKTSYPVIVFLHGLFENEKRWAERGGKDLLDGLIAEKKVGEMVVAIPDGGRSFYTNSYDGNKNYEDFVVQEFIPFIEGNYRVKQGSKWLALSGSSMGGYGALKIGIKHWEMFSSVSAHSAVLVPKFPETIEPGTRAARYLQILEGPFGRPFHREYWESENPIHLAEHPENFKRLKLSFDCGDHDRYGFDEGARELDRVLTEKGFPHEFAILSGDHGWEYLKQHMHRSLEFHWKNFGK